MIALGTDVLPVARMKALMAGQSGTWRRWFTGDELAYSLSQAFPERHLAARFAAKEAVVKALAWPAGERVPWASIEVTRAASGEPHIVLHHAVCQRAAAAGIARLAVSLSHTDDLAVAVVIALGPTNRLE